MRTSIWLRCYRERTFLPVSCNYRWGLLTWMRRSWFRLGRVTGQIRIPTVLSAYCRLALICKMDVMCRIWLTWCVEIYVVPWYLLYAEGLLHIAIFLKVPFQNMCDSRHALQPPPMPSGAVEHTHTWWHAFASSLFDVGWCWMCLPSQFFCSTKFLQHYTTRLVN